MPVATKIDEISPYLDLGLEITLKIRAESFTTNVRGWKSGVFILIDCPQSGGNYINVIPETTVLFRFLNQGIVVSFATTVMSMLKQPTNIVVLEFPTRYERIKLRKFVRLSANLPAIYYRLSAVSPEGRKNQNKAMVLDICQGGALLACSTKLDVSSRIALSVKLSSLDKITNIVSTVKNLTKDKKVNKDIYYLIGVEFKSLSTENKETLMRYIEESTPFQQKP